MFCQYCGSELKETAAFCTRCGHKVVRVEPAPATAAKFCTYCGGEILPDHSFCPRCGRKVAQPVRAPSAAKPAPRPPPETPKAPQPAPPLVARQKGPGHFRRNASLAAVAAVLVLVALGSMLGPLRLGQQPSSNTTAQAPSGAVGSPTSSQGTISPGGYAYIPVVSDEPGVDGYSTDSATSLTASLALSTFAGSNLVYLAISIASSSAQVSTVRDSSGLNWARRAQGGSSGTRLETWYASGGQLTDDNITVTLTAAAAVKVAAVSIHGALGSGSSSFAGPAQVASGTGASPDVRISVPQGEGAIFIGALAAAGGTVTAAGTGFNLTGAQNGPPLAALETSPDFMLQAPQGSCSWTTSFESTANASYALSAGEGWAMVGDAVLVDPTPPTLCPTQGGGSQGTTSGSVSSVTSVGTLDREICYTASSPGASSHGFDAVGFAGWVNGYDVRELSFSSGTDQGATCSTFSVQAVDAYYVISAENGTSQAPTEYKLMAYFAEPSSLSQVQASIVSDLVGSVSTTTTTTSTSTASSGSKSTVSSSTVAVTYPVEVTASKWDGTVDMSYKLSEGYTDSEDSLQISESASGVAPFELIYLSLPTSFNVGRPWGDVSAEINGSGTLNIQDSITYSFTHQYPSNPQENYQCSGGGTVSLQVSYMISGYTNSTGTWFQFEVQTPSNYPTLTIPCTGGYTTPYTYVPEAQQIVSEGLTYCGNEARCCGLGAQCFQVSYISEYLPIQLESPLSYSNTYTDSTPSCSYTTTTGTCDVLYSLGYSATIAYEDCPNPELAFLTGQCP